MFSDLCYLFQIVGDLLLSIVCLDKDARRKAERIANKFLSYAIDVSVVLLKDDRDPGDLDKTELVSELVSATRWSRDAFLSNKIKHMVVGNLTLRSNRGT